MISTRRTFFSMRWFLIAVSAVAIAGLLTWPLASLVPYRIVLPIYFLAVMISAWHGGIRGGLLATLLSALLADYLLIPPVGTLAGDREHIEGFIVFAFVCLAIVGLTEARNWNERRRRKTVEALRASDERFHAAFSNAVAGFAITDLEGHFLEANRAYCEIAGYTREELRALNYDCLTHPDDIPGAISRLQSLLAGDIPAFVMEKRYIRKDKTIVWVQNTVSLMRDSEERPTNVVRLTEDITERKQAEERLCEYERVVEGLEEMIVVVDREYRYLIANRAFLNQRGLKREEIVGHLIPEVIDKDVFERVVKPKLDGCFQGKVVRYELDYSYPEIGERVLSISYFPIEGPHGVDRVACVLQDITERKRAEEEKKITVYQLGERVKELGALHRAAQIFQDTQKTTSDVLQEIASILPAAWQYPDISAARVTYGGAESTTPNYSDTLWKQSAAFATKDGKQGAIEVVYLEGRPNEVEGPFLAEERNLINTLAYDLTVFLERKHAEKALSESEERYRELFENAKDAIYVHDLSGRYTSVNRAAEQLTGFSREQILGKHYSNFVSPRDLKHVRTNLCRKLDEENETIYQVDMVTRTGQRVPVEISSRLIYENGVAVGVQGTARDITDRKRAQEALRIYSQRLIQVQEAERENIARELHDEIGQVLTAVRINLQSMQRSSGLEENVPRLDESIGIVDEALGRVRELSIELRPSLLDDLGLTAALRWYVDRYARRTGIIAEVLDGFKEDGRLPRELETACFRIAQEALTNVARHAQAGSVSVQLERSRERMLLTVMDDGVGFDVDKLRKSASAAAALGLRGMEERALAVGGHIEIDSGLERGTRIRATFPLKRR